MLKKKLYFAISAILFIFLALEGVGYYTGLRNRNLYRKASIDQQVGRLERKNMALRKKIKSFIPSGAYIVIDTAENLLYLKKGSNTLLKAVVSCGSGNILQEPGGNIRWVFDTPKGEFFIKSKIKDPSWIKPDWAFIEEAKEIPKDPEKRIEEGILGDYAMGFGAGYFIHGTLYSRLLGRNVTHGCIRVGDEDLKILYSLTSLGTKIFIF